LPVSSPTSEARKNKKKKLLAPVENCIIYFKKNEKDLKFYHILVDTGGFALKN
jgi:hypothetical protein